MQENLSDNDKEILKFLSMYKMMKVEDASLIYKTKRYYRQRINKLIDKKYIKRYKSYIVIDKNGRKVLGKVGSSYIKNIKNEAYMERLRHIASIATITINSDIKFIPSWDIKEKDKYTETARRYIGKIIIEGIEYLTYYMSSSKEHVYIKQLLFDINKAINYDNIIIFVDDLKMINKKYAYFVFGKQNTYIIQNTNANKEIIKKYKNIDIHDFLENLYNEEIFISNWNKADYLLEDGTYIINMIFINTEKIEKINWHFQENSDSKRKIELVTLKENEEKIRSIITDKCKVKSFDRNLLGGISEM